MRNLLWKSTVFCWIKDGSFLWNLLLDLVWRWRINWLLGFIFRLVSIRSCVWRLRAWNLLSLRLSIIAVLIPSLLINSIISSHISSNLCSNVNRRLGNPIASSISAIFSDWLSKSLSYWFSNNLPYRFSNLFPCWLFLVSMLNVGYFTRIISVIAIGCPLLFYIVIGVWARRRHSGVNYWIGYWLSISLWRNWLINILLLLPCVRWLDGSDCRFWCKIVDRIWCCWGLSPPHIYLSFILWLFSLLHSPILLPNLFTIVLRSLIVYVVIVTSRLFSNTFTSCQMNQIIFICNRFPTFITGFGSRFTCFQMAGILIDRNI